MNPRFYCEAPITTDSVEITGSEHQHLTKVLRLKTGDPATLFDGSGAEFEAAVLESSRQSTRLAIITRVDVNRELAFELVLGVALPKGDRQQWLVEKSVELGVGKLIPLVTERGVAQPRDKALQRIQRWIVAASKQCRRNRLMQVTQPETLAEYVNRACGAHVLFAHPDVDQSFSSFSSASNGNEATYVAIGPEGGFTDAEVEQAKSAGCELISLGDRILRIETAAIAVVAGLVFGRGSE